MTSNIRRQISVLFTIVLFATVTFGQDPNSGDPPVQCAAPQRYVNTFQNAKCVEVTLRYDLKLMRVYSKDDARKGTYFTTTCLLSPRYAIRKLALKQEWGNRATKIVEVTVPAGTKIYIGIAAFQNPETLYPGGAQQTVVVDLNNVVWGTPKRFVRERCGSVLREAEASHRGKDRFIRIRQRLIRTRRATNGRAQCRWQLVHSEYLLKGAG